MMRIMFGFILMLFLVPLLTLNQSDKVYLYGTYMTRGQLFALRHQAVDVFPTLFPITLATKTLHEYNVLGDEAMLDVATEHFLLAINYKDAISSVERLFVAHNEGHGAVCVNVVSYFQPRGLLPYYITWIHHYHLYLLLFVPQLSYLRLYPSKGVVVDDSHSGFGHHNRLQFLYTSPDVRPSACSVRACLFSFLSFYDVELNVFNFGCWSLAKNKTFLFVTLGWHGNRGNIFRTQNNEHKSGV